MNLEAMVRNWLLNNRNLTSHNFRRGHISGARFRPRGEPLSKQEEATMTKQAKEEADRLAGKQKVRHMRDGDCWGHALCAEERRRKTERWYRSNHRPNSLTTDDPAEVTCKVCLSILKVKAKEAA